MNKGLKPLVYILDVVIVAGLAPRSTSRNGVSMEYQQRAIAPFLETYLALALGFHKSNIKQLAKENDQKKELSNYPI
jgi:hypothetical protein